MGAREKRNGKNIILNGAILIGGPHPDLRQITIRGELLQVERGITEGETLLSKSNFDVKRGAYTSSSLGLSLITRKRGRSGKKTRGDRRAIIKEKHVAGVHRKGISRT